MMNEPASLTHGIHAVKRAQRLLAGVAAICVAGGVAAQAYEPPGQAPDSGQTREESGYTLFHPVPAAYMRELNADRPDKTDCPFTVDAGHLQLEMDFANVTYNRARPGRGKLRSTAAEFAPVNLKAGILDAVDFQLVLTPYQWEDTGVGTAKAGMQRSWFNSITPRFKVNLIGNDGGFFALALIPFISIPLKHGQPGDAAAEGGLGIPFSFDVPGWDVGFQSTVHFNHELAGDGHHREFDNSVSIGHALIGNLSLAAEFFGSVSTERGASWVGTADCWLTYQVEGNLRIDGGLYMGLTAAADDWHPWLGTTWRF